MFLACVICSLAFFSFIETVDSADAVITINASPSIIHPVLTKKLQLRCSIKKEGWVATKWEQTALSLLTTRQPQKLNVDFDALALKNKGTHKSKSTDGDFVRLLSIVITKLNDVTGTHETVASVTGCDTPITENKFLSTVEVEGSSEGSVEEGEMGYLLLTWDRPADRHAGNFTCEAYGMRSDKHPESLKASLEIVAVEPKIADLVDYISINEKAITTLKQQLTALDEVKDALKQEINVLTDNTTNLEQKLKEVKGQNIQNGVLSCLGSLEIKFPKPFKEPPLVVVSLAYMSMSGSSSISYNNAYFSGSFSVTLQSVTSRSFTYSCSSSSFTPALTWLAIDN